MKSICIINVITSILISSLKNAWNQCIADFKFTHIYCLYQFIGLNYRCFFINFCSGI